MKKTDSQTGRWTGALLLALMFGVPPATASTQSSDDDVMRLVCFDSAESGRNTGWAIVVTQISNQEYPADIFLPDRNGDYADRFPMFSTTGFYFSVFEDVPATIRSGGPEAFGANLFQNSPTVMTRLAEGSRVGTLLDLTLEGSGVFKFDSKDQSKNFFSDPQFGEERSGLLCEPPFLTTMTRN